MERRYDRFTRLHEWCLSRLTERGLVFVLAAVTGLIAGAGAYGLKHAIAWVSHLLTDSLRADGVNWWLAAIPVAGIVGTGLLCRHVFRRNVAHGVARVMKMVKQGVYRLPGMMTIAPLIASTLTLGFGGSAGSEGPIATTGAAVGSNLARLLKMRPTMVLLLLGAGAGAGIAGIFKSPIGGAFFTIEVMAIGATAFSVLVIAVATLTAGLTAYVLGGMTVDVAYHPTVEFDLGLIGWVIALGLFCGLYSVYYSYVMKRVGRWLAAIRRPLVRNVAAGALLGGLLLLFPSLYGEGYGVLGKVINGNFEGLTADGPFALSGGMGAVILVAAATLLMKCFATSLTNNGGGVSGDFAPTLFAGCVAGFVFAAGMNVLLGLHLPVGMFAYLGLAGVMAGAIEAPLMAIFLTAEMTGDYSMLLPLAVCGGVAYAVAELKCFTNLR